ncbi:hypothetical protein KIW84_041032 [Lathyrus oleraceus]|uniref:Cullin N-terminal domain-containing protein n=1 Tax=Pisum sativum TaxID=3888 RepID=A0A9D4X8P6_PEA|nr:hypothetical protein KIW84_041032 [Pisum sativum]KAI5415833.1 hypothetical protein KIW84_041032 [Pisum sativum]
MSNSRQKIIYFEEGWNFVQKGIKKLQNNLEGLPGPSLTSVDHTLLYTTVFNMCTNKPPHDYSQELYIKYKETFEDYIKTTVLPSLKEKKDKVLLRELLKRWSNLKTMTYWISKYFSYLDRFHLPRRSLPSLEETSFLSFYHLAYDEMNRQVMDAIVSMMNRKSAGETVEETLINEILNLYSEIGERTRKNEPKQFAETLMMKANATSFMSRLQIG